MVESVARDLFGQSNKIVFWGAARFASSSKGSRSHANATFLAAILLPSPLVLIMYVVAVFDD